MYKEIYQLAINNMNCFEKCMYYISNKNLFFSLLPSITMWGFGCEKNSDNITEALKIPVQKHIYEIYETVLGLKIEKLNKEQFRLKKIVEEKKKNKNIIVKINANYCPWNIAYKKKFMVHYIIWQKTNIKDNTVICYDPYLSDEFYNVSFEAFNKMMLSILILPKELNNVNYVLNNKTVIDLLVSNIKCISSKSEYEKFSTKIKEINNIGELFDNENLYLSILNRKLKLLINIRASIAVVLLQIKLFEGEKEYIFKMFYESALKLENIAYLLIHEKMKNCWTLKRAIKIANLIEEWGNLELEIYGNLKSIKCNECIM